MTSLLDLAKDVFLSLNAHRAKYVVIGGVAAIAHGVARTTVDIDILIETSPKNAQRVLDALIRAGVKVAARITAEQLLAHEVVIMRDFINVDVQTRTPGIEFDAAWRRRLRKKYAGTTFMMLSKADLIASKRAAGRPKDLEDLLALEAIEKKVIPPSPRPRKKRKTR